MCVEQHNMDKSYENISVVRRLVFVCGVCVCVAELGSLYVQAFLNRKSHWKIGEILSYVMFYLLYQWRLYGVYVYEAFLGSFGRYSVAEPAVRGRTAQCRVTQSECTTQGHFS